MYSTALRSTDCMHSTGHMEPRGWQGEGGGWTDNSPATLAVGRRCVPDIRGGIERSHDGSVLDHSDDI